MFPLGPSNVVYEVVVLQIPTNEHVMIAILCQIEVDLCRIRIQFCWAGRGEGEATKVEAVTDCVVIRVRILLEYGHYGWVCPWSHRAGANSRAVRIHTGKLLGRQSHHLSRVVALGGCPGTTG